MPFWITTWIWTAWLAGDTIVTSTWSVIGSGTIALSQEGVSGGFTSVWVSGGTAGQPVELLNHIVTAAGREEDRSLGLIMRH